MEVVMKIHIPASVAETKITKRYDTIPTATLHTNEDEIEYIRWLVIYKAEFLILCFSFPLINLSMILLSSCVDIWCCPWLMRASFCALIRIMFINARSGKYSVVLWLFISLYWFVKCQDSAIIVLNKPPKVPVKVCFNKFLQKLNGHSCWACYTDIFEYLNSL